MAKRRQPSKVPMAVLNDEEIRELSRLEQAAILGFEGTIDELEKALGMLRLGHHVGWKPLVVMHSKRTIAKYEEILGVNLRDIFPEEGPSAGRSLGYRIAGSLSNFWKAVSGDTPVPDRQVIVREYAKGT